MKFFLILFYLLLFNHSVSAGEIHKAAEKGDIKKVSSFLKAGVDPDLVNKNSATPLILAIASGNLKVVSLLIKHGAKVNNNDNPKILPPLIQASSLGQLEIVSLLLKHGANVNTKESDGNTALYFACLLDDSHVKLLRDSGTLKKKMKVQVKEVVSLLLKHGADVNIKNNENATSLHIVKSAEIASLLFKYGARSSVNIKTKNGGYTPLHWANSPEMISFLLKNGAKVNIKSNEGETPLYSISSTDEASLLIKHGANINAQNREGSTILHRASASDAYNSHNAFEMVSLLLKHGAKVNIKNTKGETPLHKGVSGVLGALERVSLLIKHKANVNAKDRKGNTPLHLTSSIRSLRGSVEIASLLIKHGAEINIKNNKGETPLSKVKKRSYKSSKWDPFERAEKFKKNKTKLLKLLSNRVPASKKKI